MIRPKTEATAGTKAEMELELSVALGVFILPKPKLSNIYGFHSVIIKSSASVGRITVMSELFNKTIKTFLRTCLST